MNMVFVCPTSFIYDQCPLAWFFDVTYGISTPNQMKKNKTIMCLLFILVFVSEWYIHICIYPYFVLYQYSPTFLACFKVWIMEIWIISLMRRITQLSKNLVEKLFVLRGQNRRALTPPCFPRQSYGAIWPCDFAVIIIMGMGSVLSCYHSFIEGSDLLVHSVSWHGML